MIKISNVLNLIRGTVLKNSPIVENQELLLLLIDQGLSEIYRKFNLALEVETVTTECNTSFYTLKNPDVNMILGIYTEEGVSIPTSDVRDSVIASYKLVNTKSFILNQPKDGYVSCVYASSPKVPVTATSEVDIPNAFQTALIMYIGYLANTTVISVREDLVIADTYQNRYLAECATLINEGYKVDINIESFSVQRKGFV